MLAVDLNYPDMVELLLKHKNIKLDLKPKSGDSLMHICVGSREEVSFTLFHCAVFFKGASFICLMGFDFI